jgi:putative transposase
MKTLKVKIDLNLSASDRFRLWSLSYDQAKIYNAALDVAKGSGRFDYKLMHVAGRDLRNKLCMTSNSKMSQNTVIRLINNWKAYLQLKKIDSTARAPTRFASTWDFQPLIYDWNSGCGGFKLSDDVLTILKPLIEIKLPSYAVSKLDEVDYSVTMVTIFMQDGQFYVSFCLKDIIEKTASANNNKWLSIDPGLTHIISLVTSNGQAIKYQNNQFKNLERQISAVQSKRDTKKKNSSRHQKLKAKYLALSKKRARKQRDFQHKLTKEIINFCKQNDITNIFYGDIKTKSLTKSKVASSGMNKSTQNRGTLGRTKEFLRYKSGNNGITFTLVNEAYTSKTNCFTGERYDNMNLSTRQVEIVPGVIIDRDVNAAINIARRTLGSWLPQLSWIKMLSMTEKYVTA